MRPREGDKPPIKNKTTKNSQKLRNHYKKMNTSTKPTQAEIAKNLEIPLTTDELLNYASYAGDETEFDCGGDEPLLIEEIAKHAKENLTETEIEEWVGAAKYLEIKKWCRNLQDEVSKS